jgi:WD40 repeat protein
MKCYVVLRIGIVLSLGVPISGMQGIQIVPLKELALRFLTQKVPLLLQDQGIIESGNYLDRLLVKSPEEINTLLLSRLILSSELFWKQPCVHKIFQGHTKEVAALTFASDAVSLISGGADGRICIWDTQKNSDACDVSFVAHNDRITALKLYHKQDFIISSSYDGTVKFWQWHTGELSKVFSHTARVSCIDLDSTQRLLLVGCHDTNAYLWNVENDQLVRTFSGHTGEITAVAFWADGTHVVTAARDQEYTCKVCVWNIATGACVASICDEPQAGFNACILGEYGRTAFKSSWSNPLKKLDIEGKKITAFNQEKNRLSALCLSKSEDYIFAAQESTHQVFLWSCAGNIIKTIGSYSDKSRMLSVAISPDNVSFAGGATDGSIYMWSWRSILESLKTFETGLLIDMITRWHKTTCNKGPLNLKESDYWYNQWQLLHSDVKKVIKESYNIAEEPSIPLQECHSRFSQEIYDLREPSLEKVE